MTETMRERADQLFALDIHPIVSPGTGRSLVDVAREVAEIFVADVESLLRDRIAPAVIDDGVHLALISALEGRLRRMLAAKHEVLKVIEDNHLPVHHLKPSEVANGGTIHVSIASLYRYLEQGRFYCLKRPGQANNRMLPAWQFVDPVPELLPSVLSALRGSSNTEVHAFFVTAREELNEMAPAEVLAGKAFKGNDSLHQSQVRMLKLSTAKRLQRVLASVEQDKEGVPG